MALFCGRFITNRMRLHLHSNWMLYRHAVTMKSEPSKPPPSEDYDARNLRQQRPMSPHLTVFKMRITAITSITQRLTGMALAGYAILLGFASLTLPNDMNHYISMIAGLDIHPYVLFALKALIATPYAYHSVNGIRHLAWNLGIGLKLNEVYFSASVMFVVVGALILGLAYIGQ